MDFDNSKSQLTDSQVAQTKSLKSKIVSKREQFGMTHQLPAEKIFLKSLVSLLIIIFWLPSIDYLFTKRALFNYRISLRAFMWTAWVCHLNQLSHGQTTPTPRISKSWKNQKLSLAGAHRDAKLTKLAWNSSGTSNYFRSSLMWTLSKCVQQTRTNMIASQCLCSDRQESMIWQEAMIYCLQSEKFPAWSLTWATKIVRKILTQCYRRRLRKPFGAFLKVIESQKLHLIINRLWNPKWNKKCQSLQRFPSLSILDKKTSLTSYKPLEILAPTKKDKEAQARSRTP